MKPAEGQEGLGGLRVKPGILSPAPYRAAIINYTLNYSRAIKKKADLFASVLLGAL